MSSERIEAVYLTTHNWGKSAKFFQALGFTLEFETDHQSGQLRSGDGPFLFIAEVPPTEKPDMQVVLKVPDEQAVQPQPDRRCRHAVRGHALGHARHDRARSGRPRVAPAGAGQAGRVRST